MSNYFFFLEWTVCTLQGSDQAETCMFVYSNDAVHLFVIKFSVGEVQVREIFGDIRKSDVFPDQ